MSNDKFKELANLAINGAASAIVAITQALDDDRSFLAATDDVRRAGNALTNALEALNAASNAAGS